MKIVHFIVNPIAGKGNPDITEEYLSKYFGKENFRLVVKYSEYKGHAKVLTKQSIKEKAEIIVACGGDGTINEVGSCLVPTDIALGIIPIGSGNGLARNLKIPKSMDKALAIIKNQNTVAIDVGQINERYFFSNIGFGFTANIISNFESSRNRRLYTYLKATIQSIWSYKNNTDYTIEINGKEKVLFPFLVFVSNTNVMGYNFSMTRKAILNDGLLDLVIISKLNRLKIFYLALLFLVGIEHTIREYSYHRVENATIKVGNRELEIPFQIDGEFRTIKNREFQIDIIKGGLNVIGSEILS